MSWVGIVMGSASDRELMKKAEVALDEFGVSYETRVLSAHRQPKALIEWIDDAHARGVGVWIAAAGMAAALPGTVAGHSTKPVVGVPVEHGGMGGLDALLSIAQMPPGVPVACVSVNGARNAALLAVQILAAGDDELAKKFTAFKEAQAVPPQ